LECVCPTPFGARGALDPGFAGRRICCFFLGLLSAGFTTSRARINGNNHGKGGGFHVSRAIALFDPTTNARERRVQIRFLEVRKGRRRGAATIQNIRRILGRSGGGALSAAHHGKKKKKKNQPLRCSFGVILHVLYGEGKQDPDRWVTEILAESPRNSFERNAGRIMMATNHSWGRAGRRPKGSTVVGAAGPPRGSCSTNSEKNERSGVLSWFDPRSAFSESTGDSGHRRTPRRLVTWRICRDLSRADRRSTLYLVGLAALTTISRNQRPFIRLISQNQHWPPPHPEDPL